MSSTMVAKLTNCLPLCIIVENYIAQSTFFHPRKSNNLHACLLKNTVYQAAVREAEPVRERESERENRQIFPFIAESWPTALRELSK